MTVELAPEPPAPRPGLARTIGILNLLFGAFLLLCGAGCLNTLVPVLTRNNPLRLDPAQTQDVFKEMRRQMIADLRKQEQSAPGGAERERLQRARQEFESKPVRVADQVDFRKVNAALPWVSRYLWAEVVSGPALNLLMMVAGVGLILLKGWGRTLALWVAALKLVRLAALGAFLAAVVLPHMKETMNQFARTDFGEAFLRRAMDQRDAAAGPAAPPVVRLSPEEFVQVLAAIGYAYAVMSMALGAIYPVIVLVVLNRAGARAACSGPGSLATVTDGPDAGPGSLGPV